MELVIIFVVAFLTDLLWIATIDSVQRARPLVGALASTALGAFGMATTVLVVWGGGWLGVAAYAAGNGLGTYTYLQFVRRVP